MSSTLPKGYKNLPITFSLLISLIATPIAVSLLDLKKYFIFAYDPFISQYNQYFRYLTFQFSYLNQSQVVLTSFLLILHLKNLERLYGSLKYLKLLILLFVYNLLSIVIISWLLFHTLGINMYIPAGPIGLIMSLFYLYSNTTPTTFRINLIISNYKFELSNDFISSIVAFQLAVSDGPLSSILVSLIGLGIGMLSYNHLLPFTKLQFKWIDAVYYKVTSARRESAPQAQSQPSHLLQSDAAGNDDDVVAPVLNDEDDVPEDLRDDTPVRPLGSQLLDTFRR